MSIPQAYWGGIARAGVAVPSFAPVHFSICADQIGGTLFWRDAARTQRALAAGDPILAIDAQTPAGVLPFNFVDPETSTPEEAAWKIGPDLKSAVAVGVGAYYRNQPSSLAAAMQNTPYTVLCVATYTGNGEGPSNDNPGWGFGRTLQAHNRNLDMAGFRRPQMLIMRAWNGGQSNQVINVTAGSDDQVYSIVRGYPSNAGTVMDFTGGAGASGILANVMNTANAWDQLCLGSANGVAQFAGTMRELTVWNGTATTPQLAEILAYAKARWAAAILAQEMPQVLPV